MLLEPPHHHPLSKDTVQFLVHVFFVKEPFFYKLQNWLRYGKNNCARLQCWHVCELWEKYAFIVAHSFWPLNQIFNFFSRESAVIQE